MYGRFFENILIDMTMIVTPIGTQVDRIVELMEKENGLNF